MQKQFDLDRTKELLDHTQKRLDEANSMMALVRAEIAAIETPMELALQAVSKYGNDDFEQDNSE